METAVDVSASVAVLTAVIVGIVELITRLRRRDYWAAVTIGTAATVGGVLCGLGLIAGLGFLDGVIVGFTASGLVTVAGKFGGSEVNSPTITR